ncbi:MAG: hypothetical protein AAF515_05835 [Pseudomonadota bacterium]
MSEPANEDDLLRLARDWRDAPGATPDADVQARLRLAREQAIAALPTTAPMVETADSAAAPGVPVRWLLGGAATAGLALVLTLAIRTDGDVPVDALQVAAIEEMMDDQALLEDLEFIAWVAAEEFAAEEIGEAG